MSANHQIAPIARELGTLDIGDLSPSLREAISRTTGSRVGGPPLTDEARKYLSASEREARTPHFIPADPRPLTEAEKREAQSALSWYDMAGKPMTAQEIEDWLAPAILSMTNVPGAEEMPLVMAAWAFALQEVPMALFTPAAARLVALMPRGFFPTPGQVLELLKPALARFEEGRSGLRRALAVGEAAPAVAPRPAVPLPDLRARRAPEEIDSVNRTAQAYLAEVAARDIAGRASGRGGGKMGSQTVSTATLIAIYEKQAQSNDTTTKAAAEIRLVNLRARLAAELAAP